MEIALASEGTDYLSKLPAELLIEIISRLPLKCFLDLKHTSSFFENFLKTHGAAICNAAVRSFYTSDAKLLQTMLKSDWLVSSEEVLHRHHVFYVDYSRHHPLSFRRLQKPYYAGFFASSEGQRNRLLILSEPGPQFLHFLEQKMLWVYDSNRLFLNHPAYEHGFLVSITAFQKFMANMHGRAHRGENFERIFPEKITFPRELIWYYKVEEK